VQKNEPANKYGLFQRKSLRKRLNVVAQKVDLGQVDEDEVLHVECITVLRNGHCPDVKPTVINGDNILLNNTCAFDCFVQMLCVSGCESAVCRKFFEVNEYESDLCKLICIMLRTGVNVSVYNLRAKILTLVYDAKISPQRMCHVNAVCSISFQVEAVWFFPTLREESTCSCELCPQKTRTRHSTIITVQFRESDTVGEVKQLERKVNDAMKPRVTRCLTKITEYRASQTEADFVLDYSVSQWPMCSGSRSTSTSVCGDFLFIEVIEASPPCAVEMTCQLSDLPVQLTCDKSYQLRGVATFVGGKLVNSVGHYIALCRRNDGSWYSFDDLKSNVTLSKSNAKVRIHLLLYTV
jgi:hypothetical protein